MSCASISQSSIGSFSLSLLAVAAFIFLVAESSADDARARGCLKVPVGDELTDRDVDLFGLLAMDEGLTAFDCDCAAEEEEDTEEIETPNSSSSCTIPFVRIASLPFGTRSGNSKAVAPNLVMVACTFGVECDLSTFVMWGSLETESAPPPPGVTFSLSMTNIEYGRG